jgi:hypothetical protein
MMNRSKILWSGAVLVLVLAAALSFLPIGPGASFDGQPDARSAIAPADAGAWAQWLEGRLQPAVEAPQQAAPVDALAGYTLVGLVEVDGRMLAMIASGGTTRSLAVGDVLDGYEAIAIEANHIVLAGDGAEVVLRLDR